MTSTKRLFANELYLKKFRSFNEVRIPLGRKMTVISGVNGVGKSNIISLISSGSGVSRKSALGSNFQPEFSDFFIIDVNENYQDYKLYMSYVEESGEFALAKRLSFKDDTATNRGIRIIPRTTNEYSEGINITEAQLIAKEKYGSGGAARVLIPTIYLSLSRLYPLGEKKSPAKVNTITKRSPYAQQEVMEKYREWYNHLIPGSIQENAAVTVIEKKVSSRDSLHMDIDNTPTLSQSIGQDNVGNIVSALVDIYRLSKDDNYCGAILCIDEIEVSLHPDTQIRLLSLLETLTGELKIQVMVSTHSLTILKECLKKEERDDVDYRVIYLKNPSLPYVTERKSYDLLKADMFGSFDYRKIRARMYFEDNVGKQIFESLIEAYRSILGKVKSDEEGKVLRNPGNNYRAINKEIAGMAKVLEYYDNLNVVVTHLGCDELINISEADAAFFKRIIFMLDGDARIKGRNKPNVRDYLTTFYNPKAEGVSERDHSENVIFAPGYFAPESYLYKIINHICTNELESMDFWRSLDRNENTALYTADKIKALFSSLPNDFNNDSLKSIFGEGDVKGDVWDFVMNTEILSYYYADYNKVVPLIEFLKCFVTAYEISYSLTVSNRYV